MTDWVGGVGRTLSKKGGQIVFSSQWTAWPRSSCFLRPQKQPPHTHAHTHTLDNAVCEFVGGCEWAYLWPPADVFTFFSFLNLAHLQPEFNRVLRRLNRLDCFCPLGGSKNLSLTRLASKKIIIHWFIDHVETLNQIYFLFKRLMLLYIHGV